MIDAKIVTGHRTLRFDDVEAAIRDAELLVQAERQGRLRRLGNWSIGQALGHVAAWASYPYQGYSTRPPWFVRLLGPLLRRRLLRGAMPRGYRLPGAPDGTFGTEPLEPSVGLDRYSVAMRRLAATPPTRPNPVFGPLTHDEWLRLNLGHAALHQGYFIPE